MRAWSSYLFRRMWDLPSFLCMGNKIFLSSKYLQVFNFSFVYVMCLHSAFDNLTGLNINLLSN